MSAMDGKLDFPSIALILYMIFVYTLFKLEMSSYLSSGIYLTNSLDNILFP